mmetsp:Transcript_9336/g.15378  ORF Transcript_9336/g.15378 Transcript_9336/m.15378 type:complete len:380 (-) Transcript_9336:5-1144(-)
MSTERVLLLHFDINKTMIMSDIVSGRSVGQTINSILSECTWGTVDLTKPRECRTAQDWEVCCWKLQSNPPIEGALTLGTFLEDFSDTPKSVQRHIKRTFTDKGCIGEQFISFYNQLDEALQFKFSEDQDDTVHLDAFASGYYHILPSWFRMVDYLVEQRIKFKILFRTFGVDIANVCEEFNTFCEGRHPAYKLQLKLDGSDPSYPLDLRIQLPHFNGKLLRTSEDSDGLSLAYLHRDKTVRVVSGSSNVHNVVLRDWLGLGGVDASQQQESGHVAALQDDFAWWSGHDESDDAGKVMLVDRTDAAGIPNIIQVFFDDNIELDRAHIVDVRDATTFNPISFEQTQHKHLRRVNPHLAILDREYYVEEIQNILSIHEAERL